jgi:hypothetical protein
MLEIANDCDKLARRAEERLATRGLPSIISARRTTEMTGPSGQ